MEFAAFVAEALGSSREFTKVLYGFRHGFTEKTDFDGAGGFASDGDVEKDFVGDDRAFFGLAGRDRKEGWDECREFYHGEKGCAYL